MNSAINLIVALAACVASTSSQAGETFLGKIEDAPGMPYYSRNLLAERERHEFPDFKFPLIRNIRFCFKKPRQCNEVFESNEQIMVGTRLVSQTYKDLGQTTRIYLYQAYSADTNGDGVIDQEDRSKVYAYEPLSKRLVLLEDNVVFLHDLRDDVKSRSFFLLLDQNGGRYLHRYSLLTLEKMEMRVR